MALLGETNGEEHESDKDGLPIAIVGSWARDKHLRLEKYVNISRAARAKYLGPRRAGATYIDLFCGPGRSRIRGTDEIIDGSPVTAWLTSVKGKKPFSRVFIADSNPEFVQSCEIRLKRHGAPVSSAIGEASHTVDGIVSQLNPGGLHFAFLDPFNLESLAFEIVRKLSALRRMDLVLHVSKMDLQMNLRSYMARKSSPLDSFAPGWRTAVDQSRSDTHVRGKILEYWRTLLRAEGMRTAETPELVVGTSNQKLYWLAFVARHERALEFWEKIRDISSEKQEKLL